MANENGAIEGLDVVKREMSKLDPKESRKMYKKGVKAGAGEFRKFARAEFKKIDDPSTNEAIYKNVKNKAVPKKYTGDYTMKERVGVLGKSHGAATNFGAITGAGKDNPGGDTYYWRFIEFGFQHVGGTYVQGKHILEKTLPRKRNDAERVLTHKLQQELFK